MATFVILLRILVTASFCLSFTAVNAARDRNAQAAPHIVREPYANEARERAYKEGEDVELACEANPESNAEYTWKKDGRVLELSPPSKYQRLLDRGGSFVIRNPGVEDEGVYQCFARNQHGTAVTLKSTLRKAVLDSFPTVTEPQVHRPTVGRDLVLQCRPPRRRYPVGNIYWGISRPGSTQLKAIDNNDRVMLGYDGYLYIANVIPSDDRRGYKYVCIANNPILGAHVQGQDQKVEPVPVQGTPTYIAPRRLYTSGSGNRHVAIRGQRTKMKCIFAGLPTPRVSWSRVNSPTSRHRVTPEGYGTEIEFTNVQYDDAGTYRCSATNTDDGAPTAHEDLVLDVESSPYWRHGSPPSDMMVDDEAALDVECRAHGRPKPTITWSINGTNFGLLPDDARRSVDNNRLMIDNVNPNDAGVLQCTAQNVHGSILANVILTVLASAPSFTETPRDLKVVEGETATLTCNVDGSPSPRVTWSRGAPPRQVSSGNRVTVHADGRLEIRDATLNDEDSYHCRAVNKYGSEAASSSLTVRRPTKILGPRRDVVANVSDDLRLPCEVRTDPAEEQNLVVEWRRDGVVVDPSRDDRLTVDSDFSLHIAGALVADTAGYTCHADNGLDRATSEPTNVLVRGRPEPPRDLRVPSCASHYVELTWVTAGDNNSPIIDYVVFYTNSSAEDPDQGLIEVPRRVRHEDGSEPGSTLSTVVKTRPWVEYRFYVAARNAMGLSDKAGQAADGTPAVCFTPEDAPHRNPQNVCTHLGRPHQLIIVWTPVPREEHNGEGFHYRVGYRPLENGGRMSTSQVRDPTSSELIVYDVPIFQKYEIFVQSVNRIGEAPILGGERKMGYSGEGRPLDVPTNLRLRPNTKNSTYAEFAWNAVDTSVERVRGFFRGYRIQFWRVEDPSEVRTQDVIVRPPVDPCPALNIVTEQRRRRRRQSRGSTVHGAVDDLWPYSIIRAGVLVLNYGSQGQLSDTIDFETPEGVPSAVASFEVAERGSNHLTVVWTPPEFPNGKLIYIIEYRVVARRSGRVMVGPEQTSRKLLDLEPDTPYIISLTPRTGAGVGASLTTEGRTLEMADPDMPVIGSIAVGTDSANVSWSPAERGRDPPTNPGARFYVEYVKASDADGPWNRSDPMPEVALSGQNWAHIGNLTPNEEYYFRVVAVNGLEPDTRETRSHPPWKEVIGKPHVHVAEPSETGRLEEKPRQARASVGWFIILMCIIALLLLILIIACIIQRSRGQMYPVYEKEKERGHDPDAPEDTPFGEYTRNNEPSDYGQGSMGSDEKPLESDESDSLGEYEDQDPSKFNEDGSFIGQYTRRGGPSSPGGGGGRPGAPASYNTFV